MDAPTAAPAADLAQLDATATAELIRRRELSAAAAVRAARTRIEQLDLSLHALVRTRFDEAEAEAEAIDRQLEADGAGSGSEVGPFAGVPFLLKDLGALVAGEPVAFGSALLRDTPVPWPTTSYTAAAFAHAGLVTLGRTATPEFGTTITTEPTAYGPTRNPWDLGRSAGGSSGGAAAAVASGMVPAAHASDGGGSIRIPASCCGLVGLKPSRGRVSHGPRVGESWAGSTTDGVLTRTVRDAAALLDLLSTPMPGDPYNAPPPARPFTAELGIAPGRLRVGVHTGVGREGAPPPHPEVVAAVEQAAQLLTELGHSVDRSSPAALVEPAYGRHFLTVVNADIALLVRQLEDVVGRPVTDDDLEPRNATYRRAGQALSASDYLAARGWLGQWARRMAAWWAPHDLGGEAYDLLLLPVIATIPPEIGWYTAAGPDQEDARIAAVLQYTGQFNATGQPAISLPLGSSSGGSSSEGVPIGVQLVAAAGREDVLLRVAAQIEQTQGWAGALPHAPVAESDP
ncbi:MAG: amidase [Frankiaceae bacterium]|nr:amidase [Frankiaceae bacterium]